MGILEYIITALITSTVVSALSMFVVKTWFAESVKHQFSQELENMRHTHIIELEKLRSELALSQERFRSELNISADITHELTERRLNLYPKSVELVYRIRNLAREITKSLPVSLILVDELTARTKELKENLYSCRLDFQRDAIFWPLHTYKNTLQDFNREVSDYAFHNERSDFAKLQEVTINLECLYTKIETQHKPIIEKMSSFSEENSHIKAIDINPNR